METNTSNLLYNKIEKIKWLLNEIKIKFQFTFNLDKMFIVDGMMFYYKGKYCPRQYLPNKPVKSNVKVWCLNNIVLKYICNFIVYQSASNVDPTKMIFFLNEAQQGGNVIRKLVGPIEKRRHVVVMNVGWFIWETSKKRHLCYGNHTIQLRRNIQ